MSQIAQKYSEHQITEFYLELERQARGKQSFSGFWWIPLEEIAGPRAFEVFEILRARGWLTTRIIPNTYGHQEHTLCRPAKAF